MSLRPTYLKERKERGADGKERSNILAQAAAAFPTHRSGSVLPQPMDATRPSLSSKSSVTPPLKAFCFWS